MKKLNAPEYLLAIMLPPEELAIVSSWKKLLESIIGRFGSVNSKAHITVDNFDIEENKLDAKLRAIRQFCINSYSMELYFDHFDSFPPHTFYIAPNKQTKIFLDRFIDDYNISVNKKISRANSHITIARRLHDPSLEMRLEKTNKIFKNTEVSIKFICENLVLRKHDGKQYNIFIEKFDFKGNTPLTLFD